MEDIMALRDPIKADKCHQHALQRFQVLGYLQNSAYRCLQCDHGCETRMYPLPFSGYRLGFEASD